MLSRLRGAALAMLGDLPQAWGRAGTPPCLADNVFLGDYTALTQLEGLSIFVDTRSTDVAPHLLMRGQWERNSTDLFQRMIRPGDTVLDLGANLGVYTLLAARAVGPTGQVHGFEPNSRYAGLVARSLAVNGFTGHAQVHQAAVGETAGVAALRFSWDWGGGGHLALGAEGPADGQEIQPCPVVALDELFDDPAFRVHVMKLDIEGAEARALRGMWRLLERSPEVRLMFEFAPQMLNGHGVPPAEMIHLLQELDFHFWEIGKGARLDAVSAESLASSTEGLRNLLAARGPVLRT